MDCAKNVDGFVIILSIISISLQTPFQSLIFPVAKYLLIYLFVSLNNHI